MDPSTREGEESRAEPEGLTGRKARGAFFTPPAIAQFLATWGVARNPNARVLDPTCGEGVFLLYAGRELRRLGTPADHLDAQVFGVDLHQGSLDATASLLESEGLDAHLTAADFFTVPTPAELFSSMPHFDAVVGNPPFVRYQQHTGDARRLSAQAALRQGVRLSGLASSWASLLVHAGGFLESNGRLGMVLPAELLTVGYAEPVRAWLRQRFAAVRIVVFETLQFSEALEDVVLLLANGSGGCDAFSLYHVRNADDLLHVPFNELSVTPSEDGKWTELLLTTRQRQLFKRVLRGSFVQLSHYGTTELGTVTGANSFFAMTEDTRLEYDLGNGQVEPISPPGTRHLRGLTFTKKDWEALRDEGERVWILHPSAMDETPGLLKYVEQGERLRVHEAYKCQIRTPWWRPPLVTPPDLFFTYMSHRYPRLVANKARVSFLNSMHGIRLDPSATRSVQDALPVLALNSLTTLGAEVFGRSYGGGILKMEPREAATLPVPPPDALEAAWALLKPDRSSLDRQLRTGLWTSVAAHVDDILLRRVLKVPQDEVDELRAAVSALRSRRMSRGAGDD